MAPNGFIPCQQRSSVQLLCKKLEGAMHRGNIAHKAFICQQDIRRILAQNIEIFSFEAWTEHEKTMVREQCCQTLAALILAGAFTAVDHLRDFFFPGSSSEPKIKDEDLWISDDSDLIKPLPYEIRRHFLQCQYQVKPYIVSEQYPNKTVELDANVRLPIASEKPNIGMGGYGVVSEVKIPPRYFETRTGAVFQDHQIFAMKSIQIKHDFLNEVRNLGILKEYLTSHARIILHHATFIQGNTYHILLPRAEFGDLALFLNEGQDDFGEQGYHFQERFPNYQRGGKSAEDLLNQTASIADALEWLHHGLHMEGEADLYLIHMDLKPANVLIMEDSTSTVGKWVLTDFGISVCKEAEIDTADQRTTVLTVRDAYERLDAPSAKETRTRPRRCEGKHQAPEVRSGMQRVVGRKSDVWSLACITAEVVAFSLEGKDGLAEFEKQRLADNHLDDYFYLASRDPAEKPNLRPGVESFLSSLVDKHKDCGAWLHHVVVAVLDTLQIKPSDRPRAGEFRSLLKHIQQAFDKCERQDCPVLRTRSHRGSQASYALPSLSSENISLGDENEASPTEPDSSAPSSLSRSSTYDLMKRLTALSDQPDQPGSTSQNLSPNRPSSGSYKDIAICPSNTYVALLSDSEAQIARVDAETGKLSLQYAIPLSDNENNIDWEEIELAGAFLGIKGRTKNRSSSCNKVSCLDIRYSELALSIPDDDALSSLTSLAVSSNGICALVSWGYICIYDLRENTTQRVANGKLFPSSGDHFDCAKFTASGDTLFAWSFGRGDDSLYCWKFDQERKYQNILFRTSSDHYRGPHASLMPADDLDLPGCVHCLIGRQDTHGALDRFLVTCIQNEDGNDVRQTAFECENVKLAALSRNSFLITLERERRKRFNLVCRSVAFCDPPRIGSGKVLESNLSEHWYKMILAQTQNQNQVILVARNGATKIIRFNYP